LAAPLTPNLSPTLGRVEPNVAGTLVLKALGTTPRIDLRCNQGKQETREAACHRQKDLTRQGFSPDHNSGPSRREFMMQQCLF